MITREHIMNTTPENLAAEYTLEQLQRELDYYAPDDLADYIGNTSHTDFSGTVVDQAEIDWMEQCFVEWFDERDEERPEVTPEDLAIAMHLWAACCYAED